MDGPGGCLTRLWLALLLALHPQLLFIFRHLLHLNILVMAVCLLLPPRWGFVFVIVAQFALAECLLAHGQLVLVIIVVLLLLVLD